MNILERSLLIVLTLVYGLLFLWYLLDWRFQHERHLTLWFSSAGFVLLTFPISFRLAYQHLTHWSQPNIQKYVVRIVWMIPVYSIESWIALRFQTIALYVETARECYEAYVIYCFFHFLLSLFGDEYQLISVLKQKPECRGRHKWPLNLLMSTWIPGHDLLNKCKFGVLQYVVLKNLTAIAVFVLESRNLYLEGSWRLDRGFLYVCAISNSSQLWAFYCLVLFYVAAKEELSHWRPISKFLCVKMVVFFTWWQALAINLFIPLHPSKTISAKIGVNFSKHSVDDDDAARRELCKAVQVNQAYQSTFT